MAVSDDNSSLTIVSISLAKSGSSYTSIGILFNAPEASRIGSNCIMTLDLSIAFSDLKGGFEPFYLGLSESELTKISNVLGSENCNKLYTMIKTGTRKVGPV